MVKYKMSEKRLKELKEELIYLQTVREKEVAEMIREARTFGDISENSEYDEAKNEQGKLYSRIAEIENVLAHAVIIDDDSDDCEVVDTGCKVKIIDGTTGRDYDYQIVGSQEADPIRGRISDESPLGKALVGAKVGDVVEFEAPAGAMRFEVVSISR